MAYLDLSKYHRRRHTNFIVIHCSATKPSQDIGAEDIRKWHLAQGWDDIGYHYVIRRNGQRELGRPTFAVGAHVQGFNSNSLGICLVGGIDEQGNPENNYTPEQMQALSIAVAGLVAAYPGAVVRGHRDFPDVKKACPCFDASGWWKGVVSAEK